MAIEQVQCWQAKCDGCGKIFPGVKEEGKLFCETKQDILDWLDNDQDYEKWTVIDGKKCYCPDCLCLPLHDAECGKTKCCFVCPTPCLKICDDMDCLIGAEAWSKKKEK